MQTSLWRCVIFVYLCTATALGADQNEIPALCRDGHLQARASIHQLACEIRVHIPAARRVNVYNGKMEDRPAEVQRYSWWQDEGIARCSGTFGGLGVESLWSNGTLKHLTTRAGQRAGEPPMYDGRWEGRDNHEPTVWGYALFYEPDELRALMIPPKLLSATEEVHGGRRAYKVTVNRYERYREDIYFDPRRNYLVTMTVGYPNLDDLSSRHVREVLGFSEPKPGIYFPTSVSHFSHDKGKAVKENTVVFANVRVNEPVDPARLQLRFPAGTRVTDLRRGKAYTVGEDERPIGPEEDVAKALDLSRNRLYPTAMQPAATPWTPIVMWTVAAVGVAGLAVVVIRRRRAVRRAE